MWVRPVCPPRLATQMPKFPPRKLLGAMNPAFLAQRQAALHVYLNAAVALCPIARSGDLVRFLDIEVHATTKGDAHEVGVVFSPLSVDVPRLRVVRCEPTPSSACRFYIFASRRQRAGVGNVACFAPVSRVARGGVVFNWCVFFGGCVSCPLVC